MNAGLAAAMRLAMVDAETDAATAATAIPLLGHGATLASGLGITAGADDGGYEAYQAGEDDDRELHYRF